MLLQRLPGAGHSSALRPDGERSEQDHVEPVDTRATGGAQGSSHHRLRQTAVLDVQWFIPDLTK